MKKTLFFLSFVALNTGLFAQAFLRPHEWKKYKREIYFTTGSANFLGDLGGRNRKGTDYSPADLNISQSRTAFGLGARYKFDKFFCVSAKLDYLLVKGNDNLTTDIYRNNRNLNFKSNIYEFSARIEGGIQRIKRGGGHYGVQKNYARYKNIAHNLMGFVGFGVFYFDPYGLTPQGNWVRLKPLHTEGEGLPGGPKVYKNYSFCIPMGGYYKLILKKIYAIGVEVCYRKTFTDYIDDVGTSYYDPVVLGQYYGPLAVQMADPNKGAIYGATKPDASGNPAQRGDKQKDTYVSIEVTFGYIFKQQRKSARLRSKF